MPPQAEFPHLELSFQGAFDPYFGGGRKPDPEAVRNSNNPLTHAQKIRIILSDIRKADGELRAFREEQGLPSIPADKGFLLRVPKNADIDSLLHALGVDLVAETDDGLLLVSSEDLSFGKLESVLSAFEKGTGSKTAGSSILDIFEEPGDQRRLDIILSPEVQRLQPLQDDQTYTFDLAIQTAASTHQVAWPRVKKRKDEPDDDFLRRREELRLEAWQEACMEWDEKAEERVEEVRAFVREYNGEILSDMSADSPGQGEKGMVFPDSVQIRVRMSGKGFRDVIWNFAHLFEVTVPPELQTFYEVSNDVNEEDRVEIVAPADNAPTVCVIDSGIQEEHRWLALAMDSTTSRCFLPDIEVGDVADYYPPKGHGTRVAGAVLYPDGIPVYEAVQPVAWIQNARVLDEECSLPDNLSPEQYLHDVVAHFHSAPKFTKIFNHSINSKVPCPKKRMTSWAAKIDQLSHEQEVLFIQSAGNQDRCGPGDQANPGLRSHLDLGRQPPAHQLEESMRIANPAQSLHALTVGSVSADVFESDHSCSFAKIEHGPSGFSRTGYGQPWHVVKPEVVEVGGRPQLRQARPSHRQAS